MINSGAEGIAESTTDRVRNMCEIYNFEGIQFVNEIINRIQNIPDYTVTTEGTGVFPTNNASIACMKLNSWDIVEANDVQVNPNEIIPHRKICAFCANFQIKSLFDTYLLPFF